MQTMPGKTARALCPVCQEPMPPDETECANCGAFVIDEAVVRLCRAFGINREKALALFEKGFRHPTQLKDRDPDDVLTKGENGLLFLCTNCGGFVATGDLRCPRCGAEFEAESEGEGLEEADILDLVLCPVCGADNDPDLVECEICGEPLKGHGSPEPEVAPPTRAEPNLPPARPTSTEDSIRTVDAFLEELEDYGETKPSPAPAPAEVPPLGPVPSAAAAEPKAATVPKVPEARTSSASEVPPMPVPPAAAQPARPPPKAAAEPAPATPATVAPARPASSPIVVSRLTPAELPAPAKRRSWSAPPPEITGAVVTASALGLYLSSVFSPPATVPGIAWGTAVVLAAVAVYAVAAIPTLRGLRATREDVLLLAGGVAFGLVALGVPTSAAPWLLVAAAVPLALATRRLRKNPARAFLVGAAAIGILGLAVAQGLGLALASDPAWDLGLAAYAPWPAILVAGEVRRHRLTLALRKELSRAERDVSRRDYTRSLEDYDRAIEISRGGVPGEDLPWYGKGATLILLGRYEEALRAIDVALDLNPHNEVAWLNKGNALMKLGRHMDALRCFNASLRVNPRYEVAWNNKGNALARTGHLEEALRCYERALTVDPDYRGAWVNKGYVLTKLGRYDEAASCADRALSLVRQRPGSA